MKERLTKIKNDLQEFWSNRTKKQKILYVSIAASIILVAALLTFFLSRTTYVPLYKDLSRSDIGRIKEELDAQAVPNQIAPGGTSILVPEERVDDLLVSIESQGLANSGRIDYSFFSENAGFGTTDNEFNMIKLATMQNELAKLITGIEGVQDAKVMITLPTQGVFVKEDVQAASASIVLKTEPGQQFSDQQIKGLYNLISKSIPNLAPEDIVVMNQYFEYYDLNHENNQFGTNVADQMMIKKSIERDLQRQVQMMLGSMMGQDKVVVSVTTDIDFKQENREENLVTPVDEESMEGIALSVQRITETFTGDGAVPGGIPEGEDPTDNRTTIVEGTTGNGDYERVEETINNEVNRIRKNIVESPYKIRDIGLQVMVEPPTADDPGSLAPGVEDDIKQILETIVRTSIDKVSVGELTEEQLAQKIAVSIQPIRGKQTDFDAERTVIPWWVYVVGGVLLLVIIAVVIFFVRKRRKDAALALEEARVLEEQMEALEVSDINGEVETEGTVRRKQLEKMAKEKPEEFAKLLRTWIAED
ncbi:flagellar basal body M-ring protein FliF [Sporosarcina sp. BI001-red]|uniref:flagellar basal-body MS-ring/collar protein FliF n=1 Tax=Sporosarcina sp. BI001-red TaxID=2282866 RepID=UPI000E25F0C9|nr:flagellar basal-body MS-ring/collar protein FliF [Sporosarcina sp. BI001-red]REB09752.1 flagellar basal body M-ring protein FliF [Sporosarcina sp. BI001-red]